MEFLPILGTTALMANSLRHTGQLQSLHHQNMAPWPKTAFDIVQILFATFSFFEDRNFRIKSDKTLVDPLTFTCKEQIFFYECACATVIQPCLVPQTPLRVW